MKVCIGGAFDQLHKGHKKLIEKAFEIAGKNGFVFIGLTTNKIDKRKKLIGTIEERQQKLDDFLSEKCFLDRTLIIPISDKYGPSIEGDFDAIVVSPETYETAKEINLERVSVTGVVTRVAPGSGFYLEDTVSTAADRVANGAANAASRGLFVAIEGSAAVAAGHRVTVDGRVAETGSARDTLTALVDATVTATCAEALALPLTEVSLPLDSRQREALESVRVVFAGDLVLTDHYNLHRGEATLSAGRPFRIPTEDAAPGVKAARSASGNRARELPVAMPGPGYPALPVGAELVGLQGCRVRRRPDESTTACPRRDRWTVCRCRRGAHRARRGTRRARGTGC